MSGDKELINILMVTARMSVFSSFFALMIGVPVGILLGCFKFPGRKLLIVLNRTLMGMPPVVCGLLFYMFFSGVGPFGKYKLLFTVKLMIAAQVVLIAPIVAGNMESYTNRIADEIRETSLGLGFNRAKRMALMINECAYMILSVYLIAFGRAIAEVGAVSMVGGAIAWKTNVMTTAIMLYTNRGNFTLGIALGMILMTISFIINLIVTIIQGRFS